jgi:hypothetical protein
VVIAERIAAIDPANAEWQWSLVMAHWDLIASGNDPVGRGTFIVQTLRRLNSESKLTA